MKNANVALLQLCSGENTRDNLAQIEQQIKQLNSGIKLVMTPENALLFANAASYRHHAEQHNDGPLQQQIREMARHYGGVDSSGLDADDKPRITGPYHHQ